MSMMGAEEFERQYAARSGITVKKLRELGRIVAPCDCKDPECRGWKSVNEAEYLISGEGCNHVHQIVVKEMWKGSWEATSIDMMYWMTIVPVGVGSNKNEAIGDFICKMAAAKKTFDVKEDSRRIYPVQVLPKH